MDSPIRKVDPTRGCIISGCDRGHLAKGFCDTHYSRVQNGWDLYADVRIIDPRRVCCIPFCDNPYTASGGMLGSLR